MKIWCLMLLPWTILVAWNGFYPQAACWQIIMLFLSILSVISFGMLETALMRRRAFLNMYLNPNHHYNQLFRGGFFMLLLQMFKAIFFSVWLLLQATLWQWSVIVVLGVDTLLLSLGYFWYQRKFATIIKTPYLRIISRQYLLYLNTFIITVVIAIVYFYSPHADYQSISWTAAIQYEVAKVQMDCHSMATLIRVVVALDTLSWWLAQHWLMQIKEPLLAILGWSYFLLSSIAFIWVYGRLLLGVLTNPMTLLNTDHHDNA